MKKLLFLSVISISFFAFSMEHADAPEREGDRELAALTHTDPDISVDVDGSGGGDVEVDRQRLLEDDEAVPSIKQTQTPGLDSCMTPKNRARVWCGIFGGLAITNIVLSGILLKRINSASHSCSGSSPTDVGVQEVARKVVNIFVPLQWSYRIQTICEGGDPYDDNVGFRNLDVGCSAITDRVTTVYCTDPKVGTCNE